ncbi:MAG: ribonuclease P protein component [Actinomycetota bacterium]
MIQRLRGRESFARLRREGTRVRSGPLWCVMLADSSLEFAHVGFAIGRTAGPAVERNRVRRRLREILRTVDLSPGLYLFGLATPARETTFDALRHAVQGMLSRVPVSRTLSAGS